MLYSGLLLLGCQSLTKLELQTIQTPTGWGYVIKKNERIYIKQTCIPAVAGNQAFKSEEDAKKTGLLVLKKLKEQEHPSIKIEELDSMQIAYQKS